MWVHSANKVTNGYDTQPCRPRYTWHLVGMNGHASCSRRVKVAGDPQPMPPTGERVCMKCGVLAQYGRRH